MLKNKWRYYILFVICTGLCAAVCSQQVFNGFENITSARGPANRNVNAIIQDAQGYIWFGSDEGLTRYDGYNSILYKHENDDPYSLSANSVFTLCTDGKGSLWVGTANGLNRFDADKNRFDVFLHDDNNKNSIAANSIMSLAKDKEGAIWVAMYGGGLDKAEFHNGTYRFIHHRHSEQDVKSISSDQVFSIAFDKNNNAWAGTSYGLNILPDGSDKFLKYLHEPANKNSISNNRVNRICTTADGAVWLSGNNMLDKILFSPSSFKLTVQHVLPILSANEEWVINDFFTDSKNNCWAATNYQGLVQFSIGNSAISAKRIFAHDPQNPASLPASNVYTVFEDRSGVIWTGTSKGISKYIPSREYFNEWAHTQIHLPPMRFVLSLAAGNDSTVWLAPDSDSLFIFQKRNNNYSYRVISPFLAPGGLDQANVMYTCSDGDIVIGTMLHGFYIISPADKYDKKKWLQVNSQSYPSLPGDNIYSIAEDAAGMLWIGTYEGLCLFDKKTKSLVPVHVFISDKIEPRYVIRALAVDKNNRIWCGTDDGLLIFQNKKIIASYTADRGNTVRVSNNSITCLFRDHNNNTWAGTQAGLTLFKSGADTSVFFTTKNGLPDDGIRSITEDRQGNIWVATNHGLAKYASDKNIFFSFSARDGLMSDQFQTGSVCCSSDGLLHFGANNGLVSFQPDMIKPNAYLPPVVITEVKVMNKNIEDGDDSALLNTFLQKKILQLKYNQNFFSFEFAALNYINTENNHYTYRLEGIDKDWIYSGTQRIASYTDIKPGHYFFKVKGSNNDGMWNDEPVTVEVVITPPWWQTWWFYTLCLAVFCLIIYIIYRVRLRHILALYKLRSSIAKDLHDDVGSALSSIAMLSRIAQDGKTKAMMKPEEIYSRIGDTSRRMVDLMDDIVWSVNPDNDRFSNMLIRMREYTAEMLEPNNIDFSFKVSKEIEELRIPMQMRKDYFLIYKEAVNNLAKYSGCTEALIHIEKKQRNIVMIIKDNGRGFDASVITSGNGLRNMKARAEAIHAGIEFKTGKGKGTEITVTIAAN